MMQTNSKITIFGGTGLVGSSMLRQLKKNNYNNIKAPSSHEVDLLDKEQVDNYFKEEQPEFVFMLAGLVGGIYGNMKRPADFLYVNSIMILNIMEAIKNFSPQTKILYTGSTCIYPKENPQPINEDRFMSGKLEETNKGYAVAKGLGVVACELYRKQYDINAISVMPTNMYGPNDTYDIENGHMIPSLIKKFIEAKKNNTPLTFWGSGQPRREALFVDDTTDACIYLMNNYNNSQIINIGTGFDYSIKEFVEILKRIFDYQGEINWDTSKPDGTIEKRTDISRLKTIMPHFSPRSFEEGLKETLKADFNYNI
ncbi:MAG TPA: GDP-L-fucose synthase [bacterium]|nr:GDP-L-fucose synthase [bacterium]